MMESETGDLQFAMIKPVMKGRDKNIKIQSKFRSYMDDKFAIIMELDNITPEDIIKSLNIEENRDKVFDAGEGSGKSGSFFFFSKDNRFLIKTLRGNEKKIFLDMIDDYILHLKSTDNQSLIARVYGIFTISTNIVIE